MSHASLLSLDPVAPTTGDFKASDLAPSAVQHLKALRLKVGEKIMLMNGRGRCTLAECLETKPLLLRVLQSEDRPKLSPEIELCLGLPRGDLLWEAVTQATEVGVSSIRLIRSEFSQHSKKAGAPELRAQKVSDAACEQCGRPWRVFVHPGWHDLADALQGEGLNVVADERLSEKFQYGMEVPPRGVSKFKIFVGPEGGWSPRERQIFDAHGVHAMGLGPLILRVPTACVAAIYSLRSLCR